MTSYIILKGSNGNWKIKEKKYMTTIEIVSGTYHDACVRLGEIKAEDKRIAEEKKQKKAQIKKVSSEYEIEFTKNGNAWKQGLTKNGKTFVLEGNSGMTERSRKCFTLTIEGVGCVFTSGTLEAAVEYIMNN